MSTLVIQNAWCEADVRWLILATGDKSVQDGPKGQDGPTGETPVPHVPSTGYKPVPHGKEGQHGPIGCRLVAHEFWCQAEDGAVIPIEDAHDIQAIRNGDGEAYARIVRRHQRTIGRYLWRFTRQAVVCEELLQDVFVEAYYSLPNYRGDAPLEHWLRRIATRVGYRYWKQRSRRALQQQAVIDRGGVAHVTIEGEQSAGDAADLLSVVLDALPPRDRLVLTLMYLEGHSVAETARLVDWSPVMVKVQAMRARRKLKTELERRGLLS